MTNIGQPITWSVVITTRNRPNMLRRAVKSCVDQSVPCEIIVIDEGSTSETRAVVEEFPDVNYIRNEQPTGHSAAANTGIRAAKGHWIKPLDDDDWLEIDCLRKMGDAISLRRRSGGHPVLVTGRATVVDACEARIGETKAVSDIPVRLGSRQLLEMMMLDQAPIGSPVQVGHCREAAISTGGWNEHRTFNHQHGDEVECWINLASQGEAIFLPDWIGFITAWAGGSQSPIDHRQRYESNLLLKGLIAKRLGTRVSPEIRSYLALHWAIVAAKDKRIGAAIQLIGDAAKRPSSIRLLVSRSKLRHSRPLFEPLCSVEA